MEESGEPYNQAIVDQGNRSWYTLNRMLCQDKNRSRHNEEGENFLPLPGNQPVAPQLTNLQPNHCTDYISYFQNLITIHFIT